MAVKLYNLSRWQQLMPGHSIVVGGEHRREVRLELNTETDTSVKVLQGEQNTFLAAVKGREDIVFMAEGGAEISATSDGEVWFYTTEMDQPEIFDPQGESFVVLLGQRTESDALKAIIAAQQRNYDALREQQVAEREAWGKWAADQEQANARQDDTPANGGNSGAPAPSPASEPAAPAAGANDGGGGATGVSTGPTAAK